MALEVKRRKMLEERTALTIIVTRQVAMEIKVLADFFQTTQSEILREALRKLYEDPDVVAALPIVETLAKAKLAEKAAE